MIAASLLLATLALGMVRPAGPEDADITTCPEFDTALTRFLEADDDTKRRRQFQEMVLHARHGLVLSGQTETDDTLRQLRDAVYGPVREDEIAMDFVKGLLRDPEDRFFDLCEGAAEILADQPDPESLWLLQEAYLMARRTQLKALPGIGRNLGRALATARDSEDAAVLGAADASMHRLRFDLDAVDPIRRGTAAEAMYRAGDVEAARAPVADLLTTSEGDWDRLELINTFSDLLLQDGADPVLRDHAADIARTEIESVLSTDVASQRSVLQRVSSQARRFESALSFLQLAGRIDDFGTLLRCYESPASSLLLSLDGIQNLRQAIQDLRGRLEPEEREALDRRFLSEIVTASERIFRLPEEPMDRTERREFDGRRDLRYNAASYLSELWDAEDPEIIAALTSDPAVAELFEILVTSSRDDVWGTEDPLYYGVSEKIETRLLCARLLARMNVHNGGTDSNLDLARFFMETVVGEVGAPREEVLTAFETVRTSESPWVILEVPKVREPADAYAREQALAGLGEMGFEPLVSSTSFVIRKPKPDEF